MNRSWSWNMQQHRHKLDLFADYNIGTASSTMSTMAPTTLVTFLFKAPPEARCVELVGSWDNFQHSYAMNHDRRRGTGFWSGCFKFRDIVFDGDRKHWTRPRNGGLKQGGTYWYFYRLNDEVEAYDDAQAYTTDCPLLPGQRLNIIEVPTEIIDLPSRCRSASSNAVEELASASSKQTLEPGDKFSALNPPPVSRVHGRCVSDLALHKGLENSFEPTQQTVDPHASLEIVGRQMARTQPLRSPRRFYAHGGRPPSAQSSRSSQSRSASLAGTRRNSTAEAYDEGRSDHTLPQAPTSPSFMSPASSPEDTCISPVRPGPFVSLDAHQASVNRGDNECLDEEAGGPPLRFASPETTGMLRQRPKTSPVSRWRTEREESADAITDATWTIINSAAGNASVSSFTDASPQIYASRPHTSYIKPMDEMALLDMMSPTFSAETVSSAGLRTPLRLSIGCSPAVSVRAMVEQEDVGRKGAVLNDRTEQLQKLKTGFWTHESALSPCSQDHDAQALKHFSLPDLLEQTGDKLAGELHHTLQTSHLSLGLGPKPRDSVMVAERNAGFDGSSLADEIFSELGFFR